jgi:hypothetical protein
MTVKVRHTTTGLIYLLVPQGADAWWLTPNDGLVPSGQAVYGGLDSIMRDYNLERM